ncbi:LysR family transcriptional regulator [Shewanella dokdonensis]|uniref:LysR family transcriptional regulator n=1 Tax=Shewanella dokdonensis TaxID=712036 RepID=A0ABX8DBH4_9GAMM|nr:LysR family transcriptional regulator [Shewanella dokdonensis]MCL1076381.1 LysR family transcriptional regulator [Shewanella dokdonensis]QVK21943.1 LysR family transcriptional regulator [Shewanella dokdonensis]
MLKLELLESLIAVAETGNLSKAAERLCRTQSALSLQIKKLEESVGQVLLLRDNKGAKLTDAGEKLLNYAYKMLQLSSQAMDELKEDSQQTIRLGIPTDYVKWYLESGLIEFIREFTHLQLVIDTDVSGNLFRRLQNGEFDAIIATHWKPQPNSEFLFERRFVWSAAKNGQAYKRTVIPVALYPENCPIRVQVFANHNLLMRPLNVLLTTPSPQAICSAVEDDLVIAPLAEFRVSDKMQILDPDTHGLPSLPLFNESLYVNPASESKAIEQLKELLKANLSRLSLRHKKSGNYS